MLDGSRSETGTGGRLKSERLRVAIERLIRDLPEGAILPTERELCATHDVSRSTVRTVLRDLETAQRIYRRQGKGTFVARAKFEQRLGLTSHTEEMRVKGIQPGSKLTSLTRLPASAEVAAALRLIVGAEVLRIERLRLADGEPIAIEVLYLHASRFDGISAELGEDVSFYQLLRSTYGVELSSAEETIEAVVAGAREAELLNCAPSSALLLLSRQTLDTSGRPIEYVRSLYRGDRFRFRQHLERHPGAERVPASEPLLRPGLPGDAAAMAAVFAAAWRGEYGDVLDAEIIDALDEGELTEWFARLLDSTADGTTVAQTAEGRVVGFIRFGRDPEDDRNGHIEAFYVHPDASRRGLGRRIFEHALARLAADGMPTVTLWVFEANARTRAFYAAAGFGPDGTRRMDGTYRAPIIRLRRDANPAPSRGARRVGPGHATARDASGVALEVAERAPQGLRAAADSLAGALSHALDSGFPPGASLRVVDAQGELLRLTGGAACIVGTRIDTAPDTLYDLASLTKVIVTAPLSLVLAERGEWRLDDPAARWLPGFPRCDISLRQLLTHTSGLVPHREFFRLGKGVSVIRPAVYAQALDAAPGPVSYSDLNYMLLGWALARCTRTPLERLFNEVVAAPLGMEQTGYRPARRERRRIAATELDGDQRLEPGLVWGEVHDGNAWALGGVSGHAGLFAPADDLGRFARALLTPDHHPVLSPDSIAEMTRRQAGAPPDVRALGWRLDASEWGAWPPSTYWHTGFTGTSLLIAPATGVAVVLLMGGVHPKRQLDRQAALRAELHTILAAALR